MQITSLYIDDCKLLKKFSINFQKDVSILIGINGSGKSSILETIAQIFSDAFLKEKSKFGFKITYELRLEEILAQTATTSDFKTEYITVEISAEKPEDNLSFKVYAGTEIIEKESEIVRHFGFFEKILPSNIVVYYSGLSDKMDKICAVHENIQRRELYKGNFSAANKFFYYRPQAFNLLFLSLLSYEYGNVNEYIHEKLRMTELYSFSIVLKRPESSWAKGKDVNDFWGAKGVLREFCEVLNRWAKYTVIENQEEISFNFNSLTRLYELKNHYQEEKRLFELLYIAQQEGLIKEINIDINKGQVKTDSIPQNGEVSVSSNNFSEGELQLLAIKGLTELLSDKNTLFLFDEPNTYLHPSWQRSFIEEIITFVENLNSDKNQFLITTHSAQLLSNSNPDKSEVQIMEDGEVVEITPKYYGRDISTILYELMGVERRNKKVAKLISNLFNLIEDENLEQAVTEYNSLGTLLGEDDPTLIRAKTQLDYLEEASNEAHN